MSTYSFVDVCFLNESEETFLQFITALEQTKFNIEKADLTELKGSLTDMQKMFTIS